jgi:hypothetical protein
MNVIYVDSFGLVVLAAVSNIYVTMSFHEAVRGFDGRTRELAFHDNWKTKIGDTERYPQKESVFAF